MTELYSFYCMFSFWNVGGFSVACHRIFLGTIFFGVLILQVKEPIFSQQSLFLSAPETFPGIWRSSWHVEPCLLILAWVALGGPWAESAFSMASPVKVCSLPFSWLHHSVLSWGTLTPLVSVALDGLPSWLQWSRESLCRKILMPARCSITSESRL